jgi:broad specificity phosphatase PhoE
MPVKRIVVIRPGETDWNLYGRWQGWVATPLNTLGRQQVQRLAHFVRNIGLNTLYSSDNRRAVDTAEIISQHLSFEPKYDERLRERHIGHWQGMILPEVRDWYAEEYAAMLADLEGYRIPGGGESLKDVHIRAEAALDEILKVEDKKAGNITVGIISHTTAIRVIVGTLILDLDTSDFQLGNSSVTTLTRDGDTWKLTAANDVSHLEGLESRFMPELEYDK